MIEERCASGDSFIHRLDPRFRIIAAAVLSLSAALSRNLAVEGGFLLTGIGLVLLSQLETGLVFKRLKPVFWFLVMIWILLPLTFDGRILFQYGFLKITEPGLVFSCSITLKSITILLIFTALIATMTIASLGNGLQRIGIPEKMVFLLLMTYRYISVIEDEYKRLLRAARFRGFTPGTNMHSYRTYAHLAGMLFVRASLRAQRVYQAMICRGFNQKFLTLDVYQPSRLNFLFLTMIFIISGGLVSMEWLWKW